MKLILCKSPTVGSALLRWYMGSRWSHSAIYDEDEGVVYDTTLRQGGCKFQTYAEFQKKYPISREISLLITNKPESRAAMRAAWRRGATRVERLFSSGAGTEASPGLSTFLGNVRPSDIFLALIVLKG